MNVTWNGLVMQLGSCQAGDYRRMCLRWHGWVVYEFIRGEWVAFNAHETV